MRVKHYNTKYVHVIWAYPSALWVKSLRRGVMNNKENKMYSHSL